MVEWPWAKPVSRRWGKARFLRNGVIYGLNDKQDLKANIFLGEIIVSALTFIWAKFIYGRYKPETPDSEEHDAPF